MMYKMLGIQIYKFKARYNIILTGLQAKVYRERECYTIKSTNI